MVPTVLGIPILLTMFGVPLILYTKLRHKPHKVPRVLAVGYYISGYFLLFIERVLTIPFFMTIFRIFIKKSKEKNIAGEVASSGFEETWSAGHIVFSVFALVSTVCFCCGLAASWFFLCLTNYRSPLPWSDETILIRIIAFVIQVVMSGFLVLDKKVIYIETVVGTLPAGDAVLAFAFIGKHCIKAAEPVNPLQVLCTPCQPVQGPNLFHYHGNLSP